MLGGEDGGWPLSACLLFAEGVTLLYVVGPWQRWWCACKSTLWNGGLGEVHI